MVAARGDVSTPIRAQRLRNQHLAKPTLAPTAVVASLGAVQAQEYAMAKWAIGLRSPGTTDADIEQLIAQGKILRTHPLRWTHHFVAPADIRWLLALTRQRLLARAKLRFQQLGLDERTFARSQAVLADVLAGHQHLTRAQIAAAWQRAGISADGQRGPHMLGRAELDGLICSGAPRGKQITFALLEERVPKAKPLSREQALAELARRYFTTRGPATVQDFMWWSGLTATDARSAIAGAGAALTEIEIDGTACWRGAGRSATRIAEGAHLLPTYDEYTVAYRDRSAIGTPPPHARNFGEATLLGPSIALDGEIIGSWKRTIQKSRIKIELMPWRTLRAREQRDIDAAADRFAAFVGLPRS
jgi:hypothetical protein